MGIILRAENVDCTCINKLYPSRSDFQQADHIHRLQIMMTFASIDYLLHIWQIITLFFLNYVMSFITDSSEQAASWTGITCMKWDVSPERRSNVFVKMLSAEEGFYKPYKMHPIRKNRGYGCKDIAHIRDQCHKPKWRFPMILCVHLFYKKCCQKKKKFSFSSDNIPFGHHQIF